MSKRRQHAEHEEGGHGADERWLLTYADMITLLLALFILLFSVSTIDAKKFEALALGLKQTFSPKPGLLPSSNGLLQNNSLAEATGPYASQDKTITSLPKSTQDLSGIPTTPPAGQSGQSAANQAQLAKIQQQVTAKLAAAGLQQSVTASLSSGELTLQILNDNVFFQTDSASLGPKGDAVIDALAKVLSGYPNLVDVNGYTDDQAITGGPFTSNWELSADRAVNVVLRLTQTDGISANRLAATGFGASHPAAPNDNPTDMARNRRIDIVVLAPTGAQP